MRLRQRIVRASAWTVASYSVELSTRLLTNLILTRLLYPDVFGVAAAATSLMVGLHLLSDFGVRAIIIQSPQGEDAEFLRSAWTFQCSRGLLLWLVLSLICVLLTVPAVRSLFATSSVFANPFFPAVASTLGLTLVLGGLESTAIPLNMRRLNFRPIAFLDLTARIIPVPVMIAWAYLAPSVWAMVAGALTASTFRAVLSHLTIPGPRMTFSWQRNDIKQIVTFGKWINLSSIATFFGSQSDIIILGLLLPGPMLGIYYIAKTLSDAVESFLERLNSSMTLSVLGEVIRKTPDQLKDRYYRFRLPIEMIAASSAGFLLAAGGLIVNILYDPRYSEAGLLLRILSFGLLLYPFQLIRSAFTAVARTNIVAWVSVLQATTLAICLILGYYAYGPLGAVAGVAGNRMFPSIAMIVLAHNANWISFWKEVRWLLPYTCGFALGNFAKYFFGSLAHVNIHQLLH